MAFEKQQENEKRIETWSEGVNKGRLRNMINRFGYLRTYSVTKEALFVLYIL